MTNVPWLLCLSTIAVSAVSAVLPLLPLEPFLLALPAAAPQEWLVPLALLATAAHMAGKTVLYFAGRGATRAIPKKYAKKVDKTRARLGGSRVLRSATMLVSGCVGMPPYYLVTLLCGALKLPLVEFIIIGFIGRAARFITLVLIPNLIIR